MFFSEKLEGQKLEIGTVSRSVLLAASAILLLSATWSPAQQKQQAASTRLTPQQMEEILRAKTQGNVRRTPKIVNPSAVNVDSAILAELRSQKQAGDADLAGILSPLASADGSTRPQSTPTPTPSPTPAAINPGKPGGKPGSRSGIATVPQIVPPPPPSGRPSAPQHSASIGHPEQPCLRPHIGAVNGKPTGVVFTPIDEYNLFTIKGCGFGKSGNAYLTGPFAHGRIPLKIQIHKGRETVPAWSDTAIVAYMDSNLSGEGNHNDGVTLVVEPATGGRLEMPVRFFAAQEVVLLDSIPGPVLRFANPTPETMNEPSRWTPGMTLDVGRFLWQAQSGADVYDFSLLQSDFYVKNAQLQFNDRYDQGHLVSANPNEKTPGRALGWVGPGLRIDWSTSHFQRFYPGGGEYTEQGVIGDPVKKTYPPAVDDLFVSHYSLSVWVSGPRGVSPWRTAAEHGPNVNVPSGRTLVPHSPNPANKPHP